MRHFFLLLISIILCFFAFDKLHFLSKTSDGEYFGYFKTETSVVLPQILSTYLFNSNVRYSVYKIPNYVEDFLTFNKDFSVVYSSSPKYTIIIFKPKNYNQNNQHQLYNFYQKVQKLTKEYSKSFNLILKEEKDSPKYTLHNERIAYKDLKEFCGAFCLIDPAEDTMFVFKKMTNSEIEALDVLFQQYHFNNY